MSPIYSSHWLTLANSDSLLAHIGSHWLTLTHIGSHWLTCPPDRGSAGDLNILWQKLYDSSLRFELRTPASQMEGGVHDLHSHTNKLYS